MQLIKITVFWLGTIIQLSDAQKTSELNAEEEDPVRLSCNLTGTYEYPAWNGPPSLATYTAEGINQINPLAQAANRLSYASNKQDLLLDRAFKNDSGVYQCSFTSLGDHTITLEVLDKTTTTTATTTSDCGLKVFHNCEVPDEGGVVAWVFISIAIAALVTIAIILILKFVFDVKFPCRILNCENMRTSPNCTGSKTEKTGKPQQPKDEENQDLTKTSTDLD